MSPFAPQVSQRLVSISLLFIGCCDGGPVFDPPTANPNAAKQGTNEQRAPIRISIPAMPAVDAQEEPWRTSALLHNVFVGPVLDSLWAPANSLTEATWSKRGPDFLLTLRVDDRAHFHDGTRIVASDLHNAFQRELPNIVHDLPEVTSSAIIDDTSIQLVFSHIDERVLPIFQYVPVVQSRFTSRAPQPMESDFGSGPYAVMATAAQLLLVPRENWRKQSLPMISLVDLPAAETTAELARGALTASWWGHQEGDGATELKKAADASDTGPVTWTGMLIQCDRGALLDPTVRADLSRAMPRHTLARGGIPVQFPGDEGTPAAPAEPADINAPIRFNQQPISLAILSEGQPESRWERDAIALALKDRSVRISWRHGTEAVLRREISQGDFDLAMVRFTRPSADFLLHGLLRPLPAATAAGSKAPFPSRCTSSVLASALRSNDIAEQRKAFHRETPMIYLAKHVGKRWVKKGWPRPTSLLALAEHYYHAGSP